MKVIMHESKIFDADLINLYQILIWVRERVAKYCSQKDLEKIELATEEAIANIIKHAYKKKKGKIEIEIFVDEYLNLVFKDKGPKFNLLSQRKKIKKSPPLDKKKEGGLGMFFIFECVDEVTYKHKNLSNILTLKKKRNLGY